MNKEPAQTIHRAVEDLGRFVGAKAVVYTGRVPEGWREGLGLAATLPIRNSPGN